MSRWRIWFFAGLLGLFPGVCAAGAAQPLATDHDPLAYGKDAIPPGVLVKGRGGMAVSAQHLASEAGARILREGGNAVDAAVATGYALAVVYPAAGNIGGGGFMTLYRPAKSAGRAGKSWFVDFREKAPLKASADMYLDGQGKVRPGLSTTGWLAVAVPGTVAGLEMAHRKWGRLPRAQVMAPAIALARDGFVLGEGDVELLRTATKAFRADPYARFYYLRPDGRPLEKGDRLVQKDLADTLGRIARKGRAGFYAGETRAQILSESAAHGGILSKRDFQSYQPRLVAPLSCSYRGYRLYTAPPPSAGGTALCEMLDILAGYDLKALGLHTAEALTLEIQAMQHAYSDRRELGDPLFVPSPVSHLLDLSYAAEIRKNLPLNRAIPAGALRPGLAAPVSPATRPALTKGRERRETTQFSVLDRDGMAVSVTYTLDGWFGARIMGGKTGVWMNDEMDDFSARPGEPNMFGVVGSAANAIAAGKRPLSSMAPTILTHGGGVSVVTGSPGGSRIPTILLSVLTGLVDYDLDLREATALPRVHNQWMPPVVEVEPGAVSAAVKSRLAAEGFELVLHKPWGIVESILQGRRRPGGAFTGLIYGVADPRHEGGAAVAVQPVSGN